MKAERRHFEIPFSIRTSQRELAQTGESQLGGHNTYFSGSGSPKKAAASGNGGTADLPVILSGTIDLVFWEDNEGEGSEKNAKKRKGAAGGGWVIVDYKTDYIRPQLIEEDLADLVKMYAPQIRLYARFWGRITGEAVKEAGLYFTSINRWVPA